MTRPGALSLALPLVTLLACAEAAVQRVDASPDGSLSTERQSAIEAWEALDAAAGTPGTYWYEEHNCPLMSWTGTASVVQVSAGVASLVGRRALCQASCEPGLERYVDLVPATLPALIAACPEGATVEFDAAGVQTLCRLREANCDDSCDTGFHLARWGHGTFEGDATTDEPCPP